LLRKYQIIYCGTKITINCLNSAWLTEIHEKPGNLFFPTKELNNIIKDAELVITTYHHPSNWMHPNDKNIFNSVQNINLTTIISYQKGDEKHHFLDDYKI